MLTSATMMMFGQAQILVNQNFETLNLGNVSSDPTGTTAGQGNIYISGGAVADYQIFNIDAANGKSFKLTSGAGAPPSTGANTNNRLAFIDFSATTATTTNNIIVSRGKIYTGAATGAGSIGLSVFGTLYGTTTGYIGGIKYDYSTKSIIGEANVNVATTPTPTSGTVAISFTPAQVFPANTWVNVEHRYNKTTGVHSYFINNALVSTYSGGSVTISGTNYTATTVSGSTASISVIRNNTSTGNTVTNEAGLDNWDVQFSNNTLLSVNDIKEALPGKILLSIFPNPTSDILNIKTDSKINAVSVVDMTGRKVDVKLDGDKVDVRNLSAGAYLINVETKEGISTEKFIKK
ncbi:T9SS type A sorting domain-containing protein [Chryseobacterium oryzae]|uniref:T9SS type A sorting domain-containing protein n=1 Tax=Chryseobacterium oryzae TaxID=2929799 RepID=A0ABY4BRR3_9FLAO|nr:T9SS type A sorting domain-containing protein [Chryseobacterium oryzae]UOE39250.1 T9SS type A sorting domain-containing protein [Chryseobacterium oryzae]